MPNTKHAELSEELIRQHLCHVIDISDENPAAWILLQEPGFIGFGAVYQDKICWPQHAEPLDWARVRDLRLFGEKGEWHVWQDWNGGWKHRSRLLKLDETLTMLLQNGSCRYGGNHGHQNPINRLRMKLTERHVEQRYWLPICGTKVECEKKRSWIKLVEDLGAQIRMIAVTMITAIGTVRPTLTLA